jgi:hypothetical protein
LTEAPDGQIVAPLAKGEPSLSLPDWRNWNSDEIEARRDDIKRGLSRMTKAQLDAQFPDYRRNRSKPRWMRSSTA